VDVQRAIVPSQHESGDRLECYVDATLRSGNSVTVWLEFGWNGDLWVIESSIRYDTDSGQDELVGLRTRSASDDAQLIAELDRATTAALQAAKKLEVGAL
jgi:hypothetical protein